MKDVVHKCTVSNHYPPLGLVDGKRLKQPHIYTISIQPSKNSFRLNL